MVGARRIRSEKLREDLYGEGYTRSLERRRVGDGDDNVEHVKWAMVESAREVYGSVRVEGKEPKECVVEQ